MDHKIAVNLSKLSDEEFAALVAAVAKETENRNSPTGVKPDAAVWGT